ncbi:aromatic aminobenezylarsenical efflux permease ArsG family transporter [Marinifilum sp. D714]|uniref:aromatic aminobenezylarsenical efflux permease ArsG family transporter n=1 Tax=Marinifilum sp. D714 TaxID=2937523 RepID=UPI0027C07CDD|nr:aromatic aminobenezylarsenical efflux permease ArsG family transporter [Marinifilum sp. D714]MDQ2178352.1 aromatic aminobenezylarsenical efflux permease ArsG family transporter [Marinifilum sp. D714]
MEYLDQLLSQSSFPILSAFLLGIMTAISPCPLATNITATAYISKNLSDKKRIFLNGLVYTLGRAISYTALGVILFFGASKFDISSFFNTYGERLLGPLLIIIGVFMLDIISINFPGVSSLTDKLNGEKMRGKYWGALLMGMIFALAFCPYSGVLYFGMLIPLTVSQADGLLLPIVFAIATGLPVIIIAYLLAFTLSGVGNFYNKIKSFEYWFRKVAAVIFISAGLYFTYIFFIQ